MAWHDSTAAHSRPPTAGMAVLLSAATYLLLGAAGLNFATGPGYASPVFPAAGFAVAAQLWSGGRAWPGIFAGSLLLNIGVAWQQGDLSLQSVLVAVAISVGSTLQSALARRLVEARIGDGWRMLESERDVFLCLALAGPVASLLSASVGSTALYVAGIVPLNGFAAGWWNWWSGDTLGVLVVLPLSLALLQRGHPLWRARTATLVLPMALALAVLGAAFHAVGVWDRNAQRLAIQRQAEALGGVLSQRISAHQSALAALSRLIEVTQDMSAAQFEYYTRITLQDNPDIFAFSSDSYVIHQNRASFERTMAAKNGVADFEIRERGADGHLVRAGERPAYVAVGFIAPLKGNQPALGYDINSDGLRRDAIARASASRLPAATAPLQLVQGDHKSVGVLLMYPALFHGEALDTARPPSLAGFAVAVLKADEMIEIATRATRVAGLVFEVEDAATPPDAAPLYRSEPGSVLARPAGYRWQTEIPMADRTWIVSVRPTADYLMQDHHWTAFGVGVGGLTLAALLQMLLLVSTGRTSIVERRVAEQNAELRHQTETLEDRNAQLGAVFGLSPDGFVVFAPDGRIRFVNPAFLAMTGLSPHEILGADADALLTLLSDRSQRADGLVGIASYVRGDATGAAPAPLVLSAPRHAVIRVIGIVATALSVGRILYFHEVTREAEVDRLKTEFLSHAAHELRTPLTIILGYSELLLSAERDEATRRELLDAIHSQSKALSGIVNELLDLARIEARQGQDVKLESVELATLVRAAVVDVVVPGPRWQVIIDEPLPAVRLTADPVKLRQALMNVLSNAVKYSGDGGEVRVGITAGPGRIGIVVRDQGIGMTSEQLARYGERFWRADSSGLIAGTGLGVSIVKGILALMNGQLEVRSEPGRGTTVTLWFTTGGA